MQRVNGIWPLQIDSTGGSSFRVYQSAYLCWQRLSMTAILIARILAIAWPHWPLHPVEASDMPTTV
jgi:hypothetical protein